MGSNEAATCSPRAIKRDFKALGQLIRKSGAQVINTCLCHCHICGFFDNGMVYMAQGLLALDGIHLSQRRKWVFAHELAGLIGRALN